MKTLAALIAAAVLSACTSMHGAPSQSWRPKGSDKSFTISGNIERHNGLLGTDHTLTVTVDGTAVIVGPIGAGNAELFRKSQDGEHTARAMCSRLNQSGGSYRIDCRILLDDEFAGTLTF